MSADDLDFIDPDEGYRKGEPQPFYAHGEPCENCGTACESGTRVWIEGFRYWACDQCAEECRAVIFAEENCPALYRAIMRSRTVNGVQQAFRWHKESCPNCNPKLKPIPCSPSRRGPATADSRASGVSTPEHKEKAA